MLLYSKYSLILIFLLVFVEPCSVQILQFGPCVHVDTVKYFDIQKFQGKWYEIESIPTWYQENGHCAYKHVEHCQRKVVIQHVFVKTNVQFVMIMNSTYIPGDDAVFYIKENNIDPLGIPMMVTATDYDSYAVIYGCLYHEPTDIKYLTAWILSRNTTLPEETLNKAHIDINTHISTAYLQAVDHSEASCSYHWTAHVHAVYTEEEERCR